MRTGTRTELSRKWMPHGHRPLAPLRIGYEFTYFYLSVCPFTGEGYAAFLPALNGENFAWFIGQMQQALGQPALVIADGATAHQARFFEQTDLELVRLPTACPELNPVERVFKAIRQHLKCRVFETVAQAEQAVRRAVAIVSETAEKTISLTCFPYIKNTSLLN